MKMNCGKRRAARYQRGRAESKIERQSEQIEGLKIKRIAAGGHPKPQRKHLMELAAKDREIERLQALLERPERPCDVADWVERHFAGKLIFHQRARDKMVLLPLVKLICPFMQCT